MPFRSSQRNELFAEAAAICRATATYNRVFAKAPHNRLFTATGFTVSESFTGTFGTTVEVRHRGGELNGQGEIYCNMPVFNPGTPYLLFIGRRSDGSLFCLDYLNETESAYGEMLSHLRREAAAMDGTGLDVSDQTAPNVLAASNFLPSSTGLSSRFLHGDRGEPIEYVVDMDDWPAGISSNQALAAVSNAFEAWSAVTTLTFMFGGVESFGMAAPDVSANDERIYIQLHDNYNYIPPSSTLARGGRSYTFDTLNWPDGGFGGRGRPPMNSIGPPRGIWSWSMKRLRCPRWQTLRRSCAMKSAMS